MNNLADQFQQQNQNGGVMAQSSSSREMEEVKGQIFMARQFPRNVFQSEQRILDACKRPALAQEAVYSYPRGGTRVEGPSIRLAEVLAQNWGNISFGLKELEQRAGESDVLAYAWDLETNTRSEKVFTVKHTRKANGQLKRLDDPRDIYELVANNGSRRMRNCILAVIPGDIVDKAVAECNRTLQGNNQGPLKDRLATAFTAFKDQYRVTQEQIEERMGYNISAFTERDYADLIKIFKSIKDGMSKVDDWFSKELKTKQESKLTDAFKENEGNNPKDKKTAKNEDESEDKKDVKPDAGDQTEFDLES